MAHELLLFCICFLFLFHGSTAQDFPSQGDDHQVCRFLKLKPLQLNPNLISVASEAGETAMWDPLDEQLRCIDAVLIRKVISPQGLSLPSYVATNELSYVVQGTGILGAIGSGCPETREKLNIGDFMALPTGTIKWIYNDGLEPLIIISFRQGSKRQQHSLGGTSRLPNSINDQLLQSYAANNVFAGFAKETLENIYKVDKEIVTKMQGRQGDSRGETVHVLDPSTMERHKEEQRQQISQQQPSNNVCNITFRIKGKDPTNIVTSNEGGTIHDVNGTHYLILKQLQLSALTGDVYSNTLSGPVFNANAYIIICAIRGSGRVQIVGDSPTPAHDGQLREGEIILVPQGFATTTLTGKDGFKWVVFKTNSDPTLISFSGTTSVIQALSTGVLMNMYRINKDQVQDLKYNRNESGLYPPSRA
ncbi:hypothetical protein Sjap_006218 [Stephania japonica]|uniref:Cupin type-1 domain-containing protein n=1 Tax=Stephania japonica TaxID=461633 RepID=A0AAP0K6M2_9MAGN